MKDTIIKIIHDAPSDAREIMTGLVVIVFLALCAFAIYLVEKKK